MIRIILFVICLCAAPSVYSSSFWVELEGGILFQTINDVEIPYQGATRFSLAKVAPGPFPGYRIYIGTVFSQKHNLRLLLAPLSITQNFESQTDISFQNKLYQANVSTQGLYQFNSYRITYSYRFIANSEWNLDLGITAKIRDANISLKNANIGLSERTDLGFVPLLHFRAEYLLNSTWKVELDGDALISPYGRAEDISLKTSYLFNEAIQANFGYRLVEGGSSGGGKVYSFALINYFVIGFKYMM